MPYLIGVSLIWAFSFGLVKQELAGVDPWFIATTRLVIATLVLLPFLRWQSSSPRILGHLLLIGGVQFGLMYGFLFNSFRFLSAYEVALFTAFTPIWVLVLGDLIRGKVSGLAILSVILAVVAGVVIRFQAVWTDMQWTGFWILQGANLCFAAGQVFYRRLSASISPLHQAQRFSILLAGGAITAAVCWLLFSTPSVPSLELRQWAVVSYLGIIATAIGFFLWNLGAAKVSSIPLLAVMNNLVIPLAVGAAILVFGESAPLGTLLAGSVLLILSIALSIQAERRK